MNTAIDALLEPTREVVERVLAAWRVVPIPVVAADLSGEQAELHADGLHLPARLMVEGVVAPGEPGGPHALDRWRRAAVDVLVAMGLRDLPGTSPAWLATGLILHLVDRRAPELQIAAAALWEAGHADAERRPWTGLAVVRAWEAGGRDAEAVAVAALTAGKVEVKDFVEAGRWILGSGRLHALPGAELPPGVDVPTSLGPWSWARLEVPAHPRGGRVVVQGRGGVSPAWAVADTPLRAVAVACEHGASFLPDPGGPVGDWELRSAEGAGRMFGARGLTYRFLPSGRLDVVLADAFVGPVEQVEEAGRVGTSGTARGTWRVRGPRQLSLHDVIPGSMAVHGRGASAYVLPAEGFGLGEALRAMDGSTWTWGVADDRLVLDGTMFGGRFQLRLAPAGDDATAALSALEREP